jgi:hypothetical protein
MTSRQMDREMYRMTVESAVMQTDRQAGEQTDIEIDRCTEGELHLQSNRFTDRRRRYRHRERWRDEQSASLIPFLCAPILERILFFKAD